MAKTLASQARNGGSIPLARSRNLPLGAHGLAGAALRARSDAAGLTAAYQAWLLPQCGQPTEVETSAVKA